MLFYFDIMPFIKVNTRWNICCECGERIPKNNFLTGNVNVIKKDKGKYDCYHLECKPKEIKKKCKICNGESEVVIDLFGNTVKCLCTKNK